MPRKIVSDASSPPPETKPPKPKPDPRCKTSATATTQTDQGDAASVTVAVQGPSTRVREESRGSAWERLRRQGRAAGLGKREAYDRATREVDRLFDSGADLPPVESPELAISEESAVAVLEAPSESESGVTGLGDLPDDWPQLPASSTLSAEVQWVQSSRLDVTESQPGGAVRIHLDRADHPAPSKSALSWLETAILFPSKFADVAVKVTANQEDEAEHVRREKLAIQEIRDLLAEMVEEGDLDD